MIVRSVPALDEYEPSRCGGKHCTLALIELYLGNTRDRKFSRRLLDSLFKYGTIGTESML